MIHGQDYQGARPAPGPLCGHERQGQRVPTPRQGDSKGCAGSGVQPRVQVPFRPGSGVWLRGQVPHRDWADTAAARVRAPSEASG